MKEPDTLPPTLCEPREQLRRKAVNSIQRMGARLAKELGADESWRLLLAATIQVAQAEYQPNEIAEMLRQLADSIDAGGLESPKTELN